MNKETQNFSEEENQEPQEPQYTEAQMEQLRKNTLKFYKEKNDVLNLQLKHENFLADIEESQLRQMVALSRKMALMGQPDDILSQDPEKESDKVSSTDNAERKPQKKRELKKD
tara:strand:- start:23343 stop:23681 length:339 start_codon:yes stop_codon:yes gene_type:complete